MKRFVPPRATGARAAVVAVLALLGAGVTVGVSASPAAAALDVVSASPAPGSSSTDGPSAVRLEFDNLVFGSDFDLSVTGPGGDVRDGGANVFGRQVTQQLDDDLPDGRYTVAWSVRGGLFNEGGSGSFTFRVGPAPGPPEATTSAAPSEPAAPGVPVAPGASATTSPSAARPTAGASATATPGVDPTGLADPVATTGKPAKGAPITGAQPTVNVPQPDVAGVDTTSADLLPPPVFWWGLVALAGYGVLRWRRRRKRAAPEPDDDPETPVRQTELVLGAGPGLTAPDGPPPVSLTPTQGVPRLTLVPPPPPTTLPRGTAQPERAVAAEMFTPHTAPATMPRIEFVPDLAPSFDADYDELEDPLTDPLPAEGPETAERVL